MSNQRAVFIALLVSIIVLVLGLLVYSLTGAVPTSKESSENQKVTQRSPTKNIIGEVSREDFFKNANTCTTSSFSSREDNEHLPILTRELGIVHRVWTGKILGMRGTECIVELGYSDLNASDLSLRSSTLECRVDKDVFHATGTNRTIGSVLTEKIASRSAIDLVGALDAALAGSNLNDVEKTNLQNQRATYVPMTTLVDHPGVTCTVTASAF